MDGWSQGKAIDRRWVLPLAVTVMVGFGVILYGFSVYTTDQAAGSDFSTTVLSVAYGGSVFVGGLLAFPVGHFADRHGVRLVIAFGAVLGCLGLIGFSYSQHWWQVVASWWLLLGPAQAMIYYEPAYVAIDQWSTSPRDRARTLATITLVGGLAGIIFIPAATQLVEALGWRQTLVALGLLLLVVGGATAWFALPPLARLGVTTESVERQPRLGLALFRERRFRWYTIALTLILLSTQGVIAHRLARFEETGFSLSTVSVWAATASAMSLPGRWIAPRLANLFGSTRVQGAIAVLVALSVVLMVDGTTSWQMIAHFSLFGLAFGALLPLRAMVMSDWYSGPTFGRVMGIQWSVVVLVAAAGPVLVGVLRDVTGSYATPSAVMSFLFVTAAGAILASGRFGARQ